MEDKMFTKQLKHANSDQIFSVVIFILITIYILIISYPILFVLSASISNPLYVMQGKMWLWPKGLNLEAYRQIFHRSDIFTGYKNTILYTAFGTFFSICLTMSGAYPLSRKKLYGRNVIMSFFVFTMFFSGGLIPTFLVARTLHLYNTIFVMMVWGTVSVYNMIVARTFMQNTISEELYEAAAIDSCSDVKVFFKIVLPLSAPIMAVLVLFYAVGFWNSYFNALIYLSSRNLYTLQLFIREILMMNMTDNMTDSTRIDMTRYLVSESIKYAVIIVSIVPMLILYPFLQRFFVKGIMIGSIKG